MATLTVPESREDIKKAKQAVDRLETLKADLVGVVDDDDLNNCIDSSIVRIRDLAREAESKVAENGIALDEGVDSFIRSLRKQGKNRDQIVEQVILHYRVEDDAEDIVDTYLQNEEGLQLMHGGGFWNSKINMRYLFQNGGTAAKKATNLFQKAVKKTAVEKKESVSSHPSIILNEKQYPGISDELKRFLELKDEIANLEGEQKMIDGKIRQIAKDEFVRLYIQQRRNPNTFLMRGELGGCLMVIPTDRYLSIDEERAKQLELTLAADLPRFISGKPISKSDVPDVVDSKTTFTFSNDMLQKYGQTISDLITNSKDIADEDKDKIIEAKTVYSVKKGSIDRLFEWFGDKLDRAFRSIEPVFQLKKCGK